MMNLQKQTNARIINVGKKIGDCIIPVQRLNIAITTMRTMAMAAPTENNRYTLESLLKAYYLAVNDLLNAIAEEDMILTEEKDNAQ